MSIASTSVTPEHGHRCRCKVRVSTRTPICSQGIAHQAAKFRHTLPGVVRGESDPSGSAHRESAHSWTVGYVCGG